MPGARYRRTPRSIVDLPAQRVGGRWVIQPQPQGLGSPSNTVGWVADSLPSFHNGVLAGLAMCIR